MVERPKTRESSRPAKPRPKTIVKVTKRGGIESAAITGHPSTIERIAQVHRNTQSKLRKIARKVK